MYLIGLEVFAGATILGDGVGLVLDVVGLADRAGVAGAGHERTLDLEPHDERPHDPGRCSCSPARTAAAWRSS